MVKKYILYGALLAAATLALQLMQYKMVILNRSLELYGVALALIFAAIGIYAGKKLTRPKQLIVEKVITVMQEIPTADILPPDENLLKVYNISKREHEILELIAKGYSNQQIADEAFIALSTVKTHTASRL
ncbi:MAG: DNA-binding response regulator [Sphingobacteriales bacterium]|nr:MAG: DNA-binding response regulator [Sphingobacteriales bacterium]